MIKWIDRYFAIKEIRQMSDFVDCKRLQNQQLSSAGK
jgi:hypothetical protein